MRREYANAMYHSYQEKLRKQREGISETPAYLGGEASTGPGRKRSQKASWKPHQNMEAGTFLLSVQEGQGEVWFMIKRSCCM